MNTLQSSRQIAALEGPEPAAAPATKIIFSGSHRTMEYRLRAGDKSDALWVWTIRGSAAAMACGAGRLPGQRDSPVWAAPSANSGSLILDVLDTKLGGGIGVWVPAGITTWTKNEYHDVASFQQNIDAEFAGLGLGRLIHELTCRYIFENLQLAAVFHFVLPENKAMRKIIESSGFRYSGYVRNRCKSIVVEGAQKDEQRATLAFEMTREDWAALKNPHTSDPLKSYGIDEEAVLAEELTRLRKQSQVSLTAVQERLKAFFHPGQNPRIVDVGCGTGEYLAALARLFPGGQYIGVDIEPRFIAAARERLGEEQYSWIVGDALTLPDILKDADLVMVRLVAQHIGPTGLSALAKIFATEAKEGALIYIMDVDDRSLIIEPPCPELLAIFDSANRKQRAYGGDRQIGAKIAGILELSGLEIATEDTALVSNRNLGDQLFIDTLSVIANQHVSFDFTGVADIKAFRSGFNDWIKTRGRTASFQTYNVIGKKVSDKP